MHILITGGAGFIGSHLADDLLGRGHRVRLFDLLSPQVHGSGSQPPSYLNPDAELMRADVRDAEAVRYALTGIDVVVHLAAVVGVGQSMYEIAGYTSANNLGTAVLLQQLIDRRVQRLVVASSMSVYGEGLYRTAAGDVMAGTDRSLAQLKTGDWELRGPDGEALEPLPTPEDKAPSLASIYALSKFDQERMSLIVGRAYGIPTVALRFFNVFGPRQALSNPYTGVLAIFAARLLNDRPPVIYEDGRQRRDFVSVHDVVAACRLAIETSAHVEGIFNVGSGRSYSVREVAELLAAILGKSHIEPEITGRYRTGDIRHCFADVTRARRLLGYNPTIALEDGLVELAGWLEGQVAVDHVEQAQAELVARGLRV